MFPLQNCTVRHCCPAIPGKTRQPVHRCPRPRISLGPGKEQTVHSNWDNWKESIIKRLFIKLCSGCRETTKKRTDREGQWGFDTSPGPKAREAGGGSLDRQGEGVAASQDGGAGLPNISVLPASDSRQGSHWPNPTGGRRKASA